MKNILKNNFIIQNNKQYHFTILGSVNSGGNDCDYDNGGDGGEQ